MYQVQINGVESRGYWRNLKTINYSLQLTLELEAYERERRRRAVEQMKEQQVGQININDEEEERSNPVNRDILDILMKS